MPRPPRAAVAIAAGAVVAVLGLRVLLPVLIPTRYVVLAPAGEDLRTLLVGVEVPGLTSFLWSDLGVGGLLITLGLCAVAFGVGLIRGSHRPVGRHRLPAVVVAGVLIVAGTGIAVSGRGVGTSLRADDLDSYLSAVDTAQRMHSGGLALTAVGLVMLAVMVGWARGARASNRPS